MLEQYLHFLEFTHYEAQNELRSAIVRFSQEGWNVVNITLCSSFIPGDTCPTYGAIILFEKEVSEEMDKSQESS